MRIVAAVGVVDVHQHLWPGSLIEALRARTSPPMLRGWTLHTASEAPYAVDPADHDVARRARLDADTSVLLSLSTPLGIEQLPPDEARPLLSAWHDGTAALGAPFGAWAAVTETDPDLEGLADLLAQGFAGLQVSATSLASPRLVEALAPVLRVCERAAAPVLVHPGPVEAGADGPAWWAAVVDYSAQLQASWWAWHVAGRTLLPNLRICFAAGGGLAPLLAERATARGAGRILNDRNTFVDTSSHGPVALSALVAALGPDAVVLGSDRPYAPPTIGDLDDALRDAIGVSNPARLLDR